MLSSTSFFQELCAAKLSSTSRVLTDSTDKAFQQCLLRWSDIGRSTPGAIVLAGSEDDVVTVVSLAIKNSVPFVVCSGGHSLWSTIGSEGFILDVRDLKNISVDDASNQITLQSGILISEANEFAWKHDICLPLGTANTAGVIPMALGGGLSTFSGIMGYTSDNIVAAKMVSASGTLIRVSSTENSEFLYALRGAGQIFGVVTEITLQAYPISILGTSDGTVWTGALIFPVTQAEKVYSILTALSVNTEAPTMGICIVTSTPPSFNTSLIVIPVYFGEAKDAEDHYRSLLDLRPFSTCGNVPYPKINDAGEAFGVKGGFKRWAGAGLKRINVDDWMKVISIYEKLKISCPDAVPTGYAIEWNAYAPQEKRTNFEETSFGHRDVHMWAELLSWFTVSESHDQVIRSEAEVIKLLCQTESTEPRSVYQNWTRDAPLEHMYPGSERLERLKALKKKWDPNGIFTSLFL
ncbi:FAD-binding domain-containing protein [Pholiota conissans]|uniref:FAD-binding domain-containing protein n=1 Tax=Pholiota conissans TaxID=109636 RepID=A0A9P6D1U2_9AGAR|nr:FAD-binding domain-containing protein [Pholiota conissans]